MGTEVGAGHEDRGACSVAAKRRCNGCDAMTLTGPDRDEVFQWDPSEPELMKAMILAGVQIQMPIGKSENGDLIFPKPVEGNSITAGVY